MILKTIILQILHIAFNLTNKKKITGQQIKFEAKCMAIIISNGVLFSETE